MSGAALDMTLDDLIKNNKKSAPRGRGRAAGPGPARRLPNRFANRTSPYAAPKVRSPSGVRVFLSNCCVTRFVESVDSLFPSTICCWRLLQVAYLVVYGNYWTSCGARELEFADESWFLYRLLIQLGVTTCSPLAVELPISRLGRNYIFPI